MIYYITIHHNTDKFINLQASYIKKYTSSTISDYKVYCGLSGISKCNGSEENFTKHSFIDLTTVLNQHWFRMNYMFNKIKENEIFDDEDILVFMDGDAFPIDYWEPKIRKGLETHEAVSVERREDIEPLLDEKWKPYPHPLFFATRAKFWLQNELKWGLNESIGAQTAGNLLKKWFQEHDYSYEPLLRSNVMNVHPLFFGVYGDIVYHHGASSGLPIVYGSCDIWTRPQLAEKYGVGVDIHVPLIPKFNGAMSDLVYQAISQMSSFIKIFFLGKEPNETEEIK